MVWVICIEGEEKPLYQQLQTQNKTSPFNYHREKSGYGMLYHLRLMLDLQKNENVKVIGNTSGALDLVAFLGHDVYNLQEWNGGMTYQYVRLLIGSAFLTVEFIQQDFFSKLAAAASGDSSRIFTWLTSKTISEDVDKKGLEDLKKQALPYTGQNKSKSTGTELPGFVELANVRKLSDLTLISLPAFNTVISKLPYFPASPPTRLSVLSEERWKEIYTRAAVKQPNGENRIAKGTVTRVKNQNVGYGFPGDKSYENVVEILDAIEREQNIPAVTVTQQHKKQQSQPTSAATERQPQAVQKTALSELTDAEWENIKKSFREKWNTNVDNVRAGKAYYRASSVTYKEVLKKASRKTQLSELTNAEWENIKKSFHEE